MINLKALKALKAHTRISRLQETVCETIWQSIEGEILLQGLDGFLNNHQGKMTFNVEIIRTGDVIEAVVEQAKEENQVFKKESKIPDMCISCEKKGFTSRVRNLQGEDQEVQIYPCDYKRYAEQTKEDLHDVIRKNCHLGSFRSCTEIDKQLQTQIDEPVLLPGRIVSKTPALTEPQNS